MIKMQKKKGDIINYQGTNYEVVKVLKDLGKSEEELFFEKWSDNKYCLKQVEQNGDSLQYVKEKKIFLKIHKRGSNSSQS